MVNVQCGRSPHESFQILLQRVWTYLLSFPRFSWHDSGSLLMIHRNHFDGVDLLFVKDEV